MSHTFDDMLNMDPLLEAENLTGKSYKDDHDTMLLGMALHMQKRQVVKDELHLRQDTYYSMGYNDYLNVVHNLGFETVLCLPFLNRDGIEERQEFLWRDGLLLMVDSFTWNADGKMTLNSAKMFFNCEFAAYEDQIGFRFSGMLDSKSLDDDRYVWSGHVDAREAIVHTVNRMEAVGTILNPWITKPLGLYFTNYVQMNEHFNMKDARKSRELATKVEQDVIAQFPQEVRECILGAADRT